MCYMWNHNESNRLDTHFFIRISESVKDNPGYRGWGKQIKRLMSFAWFYLTTTEHVFHKKKLTEPLFLEKLE